MGRDKDLRILNKLFLRACQIDKICRVRLVAGVVQGNNLVSVSSPQIKTDPFQARFGSSRHNIHLHAEIGAIKKAIVALGSISKLKECSIYVCRAKQVSDLDPTFVWGLAKPCSGCYSAIVQFGFKRLVYSMDGGNSQYEIFTRDS